MILTFKILNCNRFLENVKILKNEISRIAVNKKKSIKNVKKLVEYVVKLLDEKAL